METRYGLSTTRGLSIKPNLEMEVKRASKQSFSCCWGDFDVLNALHLPVTFAKILPIPVFRQTRECSYTSASISRSSDRHYAYFILLLGLKIKVCVLSFPSKTPACNKWMENITDFRRFRVCWKHLGWFKSAAHISVRHSTAEQHTPHGTGTPQEQPNECDQELKDAFWFQNAPDPKGGGPEKALWMEYFVWNNSQVGSLGQSSSNRNTRTH